jgi:hypothetical protein
VSEAKRKTHRRAPMAAHGDDWLLNSFVLRSLVREKKAGNK